MKMYGIKERNEFRNDFGLGVVEIWNGLREVKSKNVRVCRIRIKPTKISMPSSINFNAFLNLYQLKIL